MNEIKHATVDADFIKGLYINLTVSYSCYLGYTERGNEIAAACNITDARAAASMLSFIQMPCGRSALEVAMNDPRLMKVIDSILKDESFHAYRYYKRVTK